MIDRQAAIDALDKRFDSIPMEQTTEILLLRKDLRNLPAAQPERKMGKWMPIIESNENGEPYQSGIYCNNCGYTSVCEDNFCPNCGADMRGGQE